MYIITGGGSGIGRALAHALAARQKNVLIVGRRQNTLEETAHASALISTLVAAVHTSQGRARLIEHVQATPRIHGLIHNAGIITPIAPLTEISEAEWQKSFATHVDAPLFITQKLLDKLTDSRVLMMGTKVAYQAVANWAAYCASKTALAMLTRCFQVENKTTAFAHVLPGIADTAMQQTIRRAYAGQDDNFFIKLKARNQLISPETVATFLTWLLLDISAAQFSAQEWDIYDKAHHAYWLKAPNSVPVLA